MTMTRKLAQEFGTESVAFAMTSKSDEIDDVWPLAFLQGSRVFGPTPLGPVFVKRRVFAGGGLDRPGSEMSPSGPDIDRFLPEQ
jgi:hypothetical protein